MSEKKQMRGLKKLDSYRLLDILICATLGILSVAFTFMISLGYKAIPSYVEEIKNFPYFVAFIPAFFASFSHAFINFLAAFTHGHGLIDFQKKEDKGEARYAIFIALAGAIITLVFILLFITDTIKGAEEYLYVLISLPLGLFSFAYLLFNQVLLMIKSDDPKKVEKLILMLFTAIVPLGIGLGTYFPGVLGFTYFGVCFLPFVYLIGDALNMDKEDSDIKELDDL